MRQASKFQLYVIQYIDYRSVPILLFIFYMTAFFSEQDKIEQ